MNIVHALFVPTGTISKSGFAVAAAILIVAGLVSDALGVMTPMLGPLLFFVGLLFAYCWVALWIKRFHEAGTSGWWTVLVVLAWLIVTSIIGFSVIMVAGFDPSIFASGDPEAIEAAMEPVVEASFVPSLITSALVSAVFAFGLNAILPAGKGGDRDGGDAEPVNPPASGTTEV